MGSSTGVVVVRVVDCPGKATPDQRFVSIVPALDKETSVIIGNRLLGVNAHRHSWYPLDSALGLVEHSSAHHGYVVSVSINSEGFEVGHVVDIRPNSIQGKLVCVELIPNCNECVRRVVASARLVEARCPKRRNDISAQMLVVCFNDIRGRLSDP